MPPKTLHILVSILAFGSFIHLSAQSQIDSLETKPISNSALYRPQIEAGFGALTYYGDVGNLGGTGRTYHLNWGYHIVIKNQISNSFGLDIFAMFGKIGGTERLEYSDANFETPIQMGGISVNYNFNALLPKDRIITPYVSLGMATFEFDPKGDKFDAQGNKYHYWSDGTLRDRDESLAKANDAVILQRDGVYETDLRESNTDKTDRYPLRALSVPIGAGINLKVTESFAISMGATFHYTFTDNLDNVRSNDQIYSSTKKGNDYLLYSNIGILYDLQYRKKKDLKSSLDQKGDYPDLAYEDEDDDGVADIIDLSPFTPQDAMVNLFGCPVDNDKDGVPDYADLELKTAAGAIVNSDGVTMTDEDFENMYLAYIDSTGNLQINKTQTYTADIQGVKQGKRSKGYRIEFINTANMQSDAIGQLLSISDIQANQNNDPTTYFIGDFDNLQDAVERQMQLEQTNFKSRIVYDKYGEIKLVDQTEIDLLALAIDPSAVDNTTITFRVQIGAYRYKLSNGVFTDVPHLLMIEGNDGLTRYVSGSFTNIKDAAEHKIDLLLKGFEGAFVTAYQNGKRITLKAAGATVSSQEDITSSQATGSINKDFVKFSVQLGSFDGRVPADVLSKYMSLGKVRPVRGSNGTTKYVYGTYNSQAEANMARKSINDESFKDAFVVGEFNGQIINAAEAEKIKSE